MVEKPFSFPFKGKVGMGMGFMLCTLTYPHLSPPLEGEKISRIEVA
jgi:hypothetical protein